MTDTSDARRATVTIDYNGVDITTELSRFLIEFTYTDAPPGQLDEISLTLEDKGQKWQGPWNPTEDDQVIAAIRTYHWRWTDDFQYYPTGVFYVDTFDFDGPPDKVSIKAVSLPVSSFIRQEQQTRVWEEISLRAIAKDIADRAGLDLGYYATDNPYYERLDQTEQSDLGFLNETSLKEGISVKLTGGQLVLFDEADYEKANPVATLVRGDDRILTYSFSWGTSYKAYRACVLTYTNNEDETISATFIPPGGPENGPVLRVNEQVDSYAEAMRVAKNRLREKNKEAGKASISLVGDVRFSSAVTLNLTGWGRFDGKYITESVTHKVGSSGYTTDLEIRKILGW